MAERDRAAVDVDALLVGAEEPRRVGGDRREGLVDLDPRHVVDRLARRAASATAGRLRRRAGEVGELVGDVPWATIVASGSIPRRARPLLARDEHAGGAVVDARARCRRSSSPPGRRPAGSAASFSSEVSRRGASSAASSPTGDELVGEAARVDRGDRPLVRAVGPGVLLLARDPELAGDERGLLDHVAARRSSRRARRGPSGRSASPSPSR